jgi:eukaryotic-like serine/threonine-protein kinase
MSISVKHMAQMSQLLEEALALDDMGRRRWLDALTAGHRQLEHALQRALVPHETASHGVSTLAQRDPPGHALQPGKRVGPYRLLHHVGAGGMAHVWLAQRADGALKRQVALKVPIASRMGQDLVSRFVRECDILAGLEHPNIARLYDAGRSPNGHPYLAMEYVAGEPLIAWCDRRQLGVRDRLTLFLQVLDAVQYAHRHHVIHRDIKPSNILVTDSGEVRLLDFGAAKRLAADGPQTELTRIYGQALTPAYASPEMLRGADVSVTTDVYALGIVLYELVAGTRPPLEDAQAPIRWSAGTAPASRVQKPSARLGAEAPAARATTQRKLARQLKGDLDAIVLKALATEAEHRYGSAAALASDVRRYLSGEPVQARHDWLPYRFAKFVLRRRQALVILATLLVLVTAGVGHSLRQPRDPAPIAPVHAVAPAPPGATAAPDDRSIAVLPLLDLSDRNDQERFAEGMTQDLIDRLSRRPDLRVIARTSSSQFKGRNEDVRSIAAQLGVSYLLEGSVRKTGASLRVTTALIRASDGTDVWSQTYDRKLVDLLKAQDEIAESVAYALDATLGHRPAKPSSSLPGSWDRPRLALRG